MAIGLVIQLEAMSFLLVIVFNCLVFCRALVKGTSGFHHQVSFCWMFKRITLQTLVFPPLAEPVQEGVLEWPHCIETLEWVVAWVDRQTQTRVSFELSSLALAHNSKLANMWNPYMVAGESFWSKTLWIGSKTNPQWPCYNCCRRRQITPIHWGSTLLL